MNFASLLIKYSMILVNLKDWEKDVLNKYCFNKRVRYSNIHP